MPLNKKDVAALVAAHPELSEEELAQLAVQQAGKSSKPGFLRQAWDRLNTPLIDLPDPENPVAKFGVNMLEGLTSPIGIGLTVAAPVASLGRAAGLLGLSRAAKGAELGLNAALAGQGAYTAMTAQNPGQLAGGLLQTGLSGLGIRSSLRRPANVLSREQLQDFVKSTQEFGGASVGSRGNLAGEDLAAVGLYPERELVLPPGKPLTEKLAARYAARNADLLKNPQTHMGGWRVGEGESDMFPAGSTVLDVGGTTPSRAAARHAGEQMEQNSIFDLKSFESTPTFSGQRKGNYLPIGERLRTLMPKPGITQPNFAPELAPLNAMRDWKNPALLERMKGMRDQFKEQGLLDTEQLTAIRRALKTEGMPDLEVQEAMKAFDTIPFPKYKGIDFDKRLPIEKLLKRDPKGGVQFTEFVKRRIRLAVKEAEEEGVAGWDDPEWLYHFTGGDPNLAISTARGMSIMSPRNTTDINALMGMEAIARALEYKSFNLTKLAKHPMAKRPAFPEEMGARLRQTFEQGTPLGSLKTESLARGTLGSPDVLPVDRWVARLIGHMGDKPTPANQWHIMEAWRKLAAEDGMEMFPHMAQAWTGIQKIAYTMPENLVAGAKVSPSYRDTILKVLGGNLGSVRDPNWRKYLLENIKTLYANLGDEADRLPGFLPEAPVTNNYMMPMEQWRQAIADFLAKQPLSTLGGRKAAPVWKPRKKAS